MEKQTLLKSDFKAGNFYTHVQPKSAGVWVIEVIETNKSCNYVYTGAGLILSKDCIWDNNPTSYTKDAIYRLSTPEEIQHFHKAAKENGYISPIISYEVAYEIY